MVLYASQDGQGGGQVPQLPAFPTTQNSPLDPFSSTQASAYGASAAYQSVPVTGLGAERADMPSPSKLTIVDNSSYLSRITEKVGVANFLVIDRATGNKQYQTENFFARNVTVTPGESASLVKTNEGFTLYSPDKSPTTITLTGSLLSGDDWKDAAQPGRIGHTDWYSKFLSDYASRFSSSASEANGTDVWFSFEFFYANVFVLGMRAASSADSPTVHDFSLEMVAKKIVVVPRSDPKGSGPDNPPKADAPADSSNGTGTAPNIQINGQPAVAPDGPVPQTLGAWAPDGNVNPTFIPIQATAVQDATTNVYKQVPQ